WRLHGWRAVLHRQRSVRSGLRRDRRRDRVDRLQRARGRVRALYRRQLRRARLLSDGLPPTRRGARAMIDARLAWLTVFFALYASYCVFWGLDSARARRGAMEFFLADRALPVWVFAASATAASFTGWVAIGLPATIFRDGFQASGLALGAIVIPLGGALVVSRQWMLSRRFGFVTPVEMYADYIGGPLIRPIVLGIAVLFALPFLGLQM